jgi:hypothetical protein
LDQFISDSATSVLSPCPFVTVGHRYQGNRKRLHRVRVREGEGAIYFQCVSTLRVVVWMPKSGLRRDSWNDLGGSFPEAGFDIGDEHHTFELIIRQLRCPDL